MNDFLDSLNKTENSIFDYSFSKDELLLLAKFFRQKQEDVPSGLANFCLKIDDAVYNSMSIDEARRFYS